MKLMRLGLALTALATLPVHAQEFWDTSFQLIAGQQRGAEAAGLGQKGYYGLSMAGAYAVLPKGSVVFDLGYTFNPKATHTEEALIEVEGRTQTWFSSALYRHELPWLGLSVQGGLRLHSSVHKERLIYSVTSSEEEAGPRTTAIRPVVGLHVRFDDKISLGLNLTSSQVKTVLGETKKGTRMELALGIHLSK